MKNWLDLSMRDASSSTDTIEPGGLSLIRNGESPRQWDTDPGHISTSKTGFGLAGASPGPVPRIDVLLPDADIAVQTLCHQISTEYVRLFKRQVQAARPASRRLSLRAHTIALVLGQARAPISGADIARLIRYDPATVTRTLRTLRKFTKVSSDPNDSRKKLFALNAAGETLRTGYLNDWNQVIARAERATDLPQALTMAHRYQAWHDVLYDLKDRAAHYADYRPDEVQAYDTGLGRMPKSALRDVRGIEARPESFFRFFCEQIHNDMVIGLDRHAVRAISERHDISVTDLRVAIGAFYLGGDVSAARVARLLRFDSATLTRSVRTLSAADLARTEADPRDRRQRLLILTETGIDMCESYIRRTRALSDEIDAHFNTTFGPERRRRSLDALFALRARAIAFAELPPGLLS